MTDDRSPDPLANWSVAFDANGLRGESARKASPPGADLVPMYRDGTAELAPRRQGVPFTGLGGQTWGYGPPYGDPWTWSRLGGLLPGSKLDYAREAGDLWRNSVVAIALGWIADNFSDARLIVSKRATGAHEADEPIADHALSKLLNRPNPFYSARALWAATVLSLKIDGNAFWIKARGMGGYGPPLQVWWTPPWTVFPQWPTGPTTTFIDHYKYVVDGRVYRLDPKDVVHFRDGIDPYNLRLGLGRLKGVLRAICSVNEADGYTASILRNMGIPGILFSPDPSDQLSTFDDAGVLALLERFKQQVGGENRGQPFGVTTPIRATKLGLSPQELALDTITELPIAQVCAALRIAPMVLGLPDPGRTYSNLQEAREAAWLDCLVPLQNLLVEDGLQTQLLPDLGDPEAEICGWDRTKVLALQGDSQVKTQAAVSLFTADLLPQNRALEVAGLAPVDGGDERYHSKTGPPASIEEMQQAAEDQGGDGEPDGDEPAEPDDGKAATKAEVDDGPPFKAHGGVQHFRGKEGHWITTHTGRHFFIRGPVNDRTGAAAGKVIESHKKARAAMLKRQGKEHAQLTREQARDRKNARASHRYQAKVNGTHEAPRGSDVRKRQADRTREHRALLRNMHPDERQKLAQRHAEERAEHHERVREAIGKVRAGQSAHLRKREELIEAVRKQRDTNVAAGKALTEPEPEPEPEPPSA